MEHLTELNKEEIIRLGFEITNSNPHIYDIESTGKLFNILRYKGEDKFMVDFRSYYDECVFSGFKYVYEIESLISILKDKIKLESQ